MRWLAWTLLPLLTSVAALASADATPKPAPVAPAGDAPPEPPRTRLLLNNLVAFRYNPLGLEDQVRLGLQTRLYRSQDARLRDNFIFTGVSPKINPAFVKLGPSIEIQPLSIFNLRLAAEFIGFYSTFGAVQSFRSPTAEYSDTALLAGRDAKRNYATYGAHAMIEPTLQVKFGPFVVRDKVAIEYWKINVRDGDTVWYDITLDTLVPADGWVVTNDLDALYLHDFKDWKGRFKGARLTAGLRYTTVQPIYRERNFQPGDARSLADNNHHRAGPLVAFTFFDRGFTQFNRPTALVLANWYLDHRFRTGRDVSGAIPYLIVGFSFQSDLLE
jgi:hypothetical protein